MTARTAIAPLPCAVSADAPSNEERPWGAFWRLDCSAAPQVKRIRVKPQGSLSLQYRRQRPERWVVIEGTATIPVDDLSMAVAPGGVGTIPKCAVHLLENHTQSPVDIIEVQMGDYLGEDDIVRLDDAPNRPAREVRA